MNPKIKCFDEIPDLKSKLKSLVSDDMPEDEQREIAKKIALDYYKELYSDLNKLKKEVGVKNIKPYEAPVVDEEAIKKIIQEYELAVEALTPKEQKKSDQPVSEEPKVEEEKTEPKVEKQEPLAEEPPPTPPTDKSEASSGKEGVGITHAQTEQTRERYGFGEYENVDRSTVAEWDRQADERLRAEGPDVVLNKMRNGDIPSPVEQRMMLKIVAYYDNLVSNSPTAENFRNYKEAVELSDRAGGTLAGQSLVARKGASIPDDTLASFMLRRAEEIGVDALTPGQQIATEMMFDKIKEAQKKFDDYVAQKENEFSIREANLAVEEMKKKSANKKRTSKDLAEERKNIVADILDKFAKKNDSSVSFLGAGKLVEIAPDVLKLARNLVESGVVTLSEIITNIKDELKTGIPDIEETEIRQIIAGQHTERKKTKNELAEIWQDLKTEAKLLEELESLNRGEEPVKEEKKVKKNIALEDLRKKIKDHPLTKMSEERARDEKRITELKDRLARLEAGIAPPSTPNEKRAISEEIKILQQRIKDHDLQKISDAKKKIKSEIAKVKDKIDRGEFSKEEKKELILDEEGRVLQRELSSLRREWEVMVLKDAYAKRTKQQKAFDEVAKIANVPRSIMASMDLSALLNQGLIPTLSHPKMAAQAMSQMYESMKNPKEFDRWFQMVKDSPRYDLITKKMGIRITDPLSPFMEAREEAFGGGYAEKIPFIGTNLIKGSERAYVQYLNKLRWDMANNMISRWEDSGKTYKNSEKLYKFTGRFVNDITGSAELPFTLEKYAGFFNSIFFSPRLMISRMRLLSPYYLMAAPNEIKKEYLKEMGKAMTAVFAVIGAFALKGLSQDDDDPNKISVELDPRSSDFAKIRQGDTRWNPLGGFQSLLRTYAQVGKGQAKSANTGIIRDLDPDAPFGESRGSVIGRYFRSKLSPVAGTLVDWAQGRNVVGEPFSWKDAAIRSVIPLSVQSVIEAWDQYGPGSLPKVLLPNMIGISTQTYKPREREIKKTIQYSSKVNGKTVRRKVELTDEQYDYYEKEARTLIDKYVGQLNKLKEFEEVDLETQVKLRTVVESAAIREAEEKTEKKYSHQFPKPSTEEIQKSNDDKARQENIKKTLGIKK